jgi:Pectate lyase superfamily protein
MTLTTQKVKQSGTGATNRNVIDKLNDMVSVKDFGAVGNGIINDAPAIQTAINFASVTGKTVFVPAGIYRLDSGVSITSPLSGGFGLVGDGWSTIDSSFNTSGGTRFYYYGSGSALSIVGTALDNIENVHFSGFSIENKSGTTGTTKGIYTTFARWNKFESLYVAGFDIGIDHNHLCWMNSFKNLLVYNNATYGINNSSDGEDSSFDTCYIRYNGVANVVINGAKNCTFTTCDMSNAPNGLLMYGADGASADHANLIGCIFEDCTTTSISLDSASSTPVLYPIVNIVGGRFFKTTSPATYAIKAVKWSTIYAVGFESNYPNFIDTTSGPGDTGIIQIGASKHTGGSAMVVGSGRSTRITDQNHNAVVTVSNGSMSNGWVNNAEKQASYFLDQNNIVHLGGQVQAGSVGTKVFTLPVGCRPQAVSRFAVASNGGFGECYIDPTGDVYALVGSNTRFSFEGISFFAYT